MEPIGRSTRAGNKMRYRREWCAGLEPRRRRPKSRAKPAIMEHAPIRVSVLAFPHTLTPAIQALTRTVSSSPGRNSYYPALAGALLEYDSKRDWRRARTTYWSCECAATLRCRAENNSLVTVPAIGSHNDFPHQRQGHNCQPQGLPRLQDEGDNHCRICRL